MAKKGARVPGMIDQGRYSARQRRFGVHLAQLAAMKGWKLQEGERIVAAVAVQELGTNQPQTASLSGSR